MNTTRLNFIFSKEALIILFFSIIVKIPDINVLLRGDIETYVLIADSYLRGEFTSYFDNKSQIVHSIYAAILYLSGHDLRIFQLYGILILFFTGLLISKSFKEKQNSYNLIDNTGKSSNFGGSIGGDSETLMIID